MPPKPTLLAFDTAAAHCAAVLVQGDEILAARVEPMAKGQAERLFPLLEDVLAEGARNWSDLAALAVGTGPGNFTGIRISVAAARGLALSLAIPAIGVARPDAMAYGTKGCATTLIDARQNRLYVQRFNKGQAQNAVQITERADLSAADTLLSDADIDDLITTVIPTKTCLFNAAQIAANQLGTDQPSPAPLYVRAPDAALPADPPPTILP